MAEIKIAMISSTIQDLPDHREILLKACLRQSVFPSMMEHWPSLDSDGIAASLKKVDEAEIYIAIIAHRYGFVPKGQNTSITEMEYERAVKRGIPRLIFLMDELHPLNISQVEIETTEKLRAFKERLKRERVVSFFKSADDLSAKAIQSLSSLGTVSASTLKTSASHSAAYEPVFDPRNYVFYVPYRPKGDQVVGRDVALKGVRNQLVSGHKTAIGQTASFQGLGGLGKTQLAVEYAQLYRDQYPNGVVWLNADQDIDGQLIKIAEKADWVAAGSEHKDKLAIAKQRIKTHSHCLIIFDNLEKLEAIQEFLPDPEAEPHILVTSRFDQPNFVPVPLDILDSELSIKLLAQEAGQSPSTENEFKAAKDIAESLGGLPLALELAGAYLRHRPIGWVSYRDLLNQNLKAAMPGKFLSGSFTRHESDIYSTLKINEDILSEEPLLREILNILTWSGSSAMCQPLLGALLDTENQPHFRTALSLGVSLRLLQKTPGSESYTLHRLVREVRREEVPLAERWDWAVKLSKKLADWFQPLKRDFAKLPAFEAEIGHLRAWQNNIMQKAPKLASRLVWLQAYPPFHRGHPKEALDWLQNADRLLGEVQEDDLELKANLLTDLCTINNQLGDYTKSKRCGEQALEIRIKLYGEDNSETAMSFHNLGGVLNRMERPEEALIYAKRALAIYESIHGKEHMDTAMALDGLGHCYLGLGKIKESLAFAEQALSIREKVLGYLHPDTAMSFTNVGRLCAECGDHSRALQCEEKALEIVNTLFGSQSAIKASVLTTFGLIYSKGGDFKRALDYSAEAWAMRKELFGDQHPESFHSAANVATCHCELGRAHIGFQIIDDCLKKTHKDDQIHDYLKNKKRNLQSRYQRPGFRQIPKRNKS